MSNLPKNKKMMNKLVLLCCVLLMMCGNVFAIQVTTTHTLFYNKSKEDSNQLDANIIIAWRAQNSSLHFLKNEEGEYFCKIICLIRFSNDSQLLKEEIFTINTPARHTLKEASEVIVEDQYQYNFPEGKYNLELVLYEPKYKKNLYRYTDSIVVPSIKKDVFFLSEIQLLDHYGIATKNSIYNRNGYFHLPLTSAYIDEYKDSVSFYYELYRPSKVDAKNAVQKISTYISYRPFASPVPTYERVDTLKEQSNFHVSFPSAFLTSGNYYINVVLSDKYDAVIDKQSLFFQRYNSRPDSVTKAKITAVADSINSDTTNATHILDLTNTFVGKYTASQVRAILKMLALIAEPNEGASINGFLARPNELYSKFFIYNFFEKRNKLNPEKAWNEYALKIKEVNKLFRESSIPGYQTERGRIYIQYGKPNDRIIVNNEQAALPYEVWQYYNLEKTGREGVFLFYRTGKSVSDYVLLHSNVVGERRNTNWRNLLYNNNISGSDGLSTDSQAEQYIGNK